VVFGGRAISTASLLGQSLDVAGDDRPFDDLIAALEAMLASG
jgi:hypothetical protein